MEKTAINSIERNGIVDIFFIDGFHYVVNLKTGFKSEKIKSQSIAFIVYDRQIVNNYN